MDLVNSIPGSNSFTLPNAEPGTYVEPSADTVTAIDAAVLELYEKSNIVYPNPLMPANMSPWQMYSSKTLSDEYNKFHFHRLLIISW